MKDVIIKLIKKVIIPKYGDVGYSVSDENIYSGKKDEMLVSLYAYNMEDNAKEIIDDTKMILTMLGLEDVRVNNLNVGDINLIQFSCKLTK